MRITKNRIIKLVYIIAIPLIITIFVVILTFITRWNNLSHYGAGKNIRMQRLNLKR